MFQRIKAILSDRRARIERDRQIARISAKVEAARQRHAATRGYELELYRMTHEALRRE